MSGGRFNFNQYQIQEIAEKIQEYIDRNGKPLPKEELEYKARIMPDDWFDRYPEDKYYIKYEDEVIEEFKKGVECLNKAYIYAQRIDWLLSGDDGEEAFLRRLREELNELENYHLIKKDCK